jgi:drug/metabolite transporter (DMT)-like permease
VSRPSLIRLGALALLWGSGFFWLKLALHGLNPLQIVLGRMMAGAAVMLAVMALGRHTLPRKVTPWAHLAAMAVIGNIAPYLLFGWGVERVASGLAGVLNATTPLFTVAFALATRSERRLPPVRMVGLLLGFVGVLVLAAPWRTTAQGSSLFGVGACLLGAACYAASYVYARRFLTGRGVSALVLSTGQLAAGAALLLLAAPVAARDPITVTPTVLASVLALGVLGTGIAYVLNYQLITDEGAVAASTVTYLIPIVALVLGTLVLNEPLTWSLLVGATIVLVGVAMSEGRFGKAQQRPVLHGESEHGRVR